MEKISSKENFIRLVEQYQNLVFSICLKMTGDYFAAEDLTQETFIAAYKNLEAFDGQSEKAWLCRIAGNKCIDYHRAAARRMVPTEEEEMYETATAERNGPLETVMTGVVMEELHQCIVSLPAPYEEIARMHFEQGRTAKEIAEYTGMGLKTVQTRIYRAREKLKQTYRKEMLEE